MTSWAPDSPRPKRRYRRRAPHAQVLGRYMDAPGFLVENPNSARRGVAPATARAHSLTTAETDAIYNAKRDYRPLKVTTPLDHDRLGRSLPMARRSTSAYII